MDEAWGLEKTTKLNTNFHLIRSKMLNFSIDVKHTAFFKRN